jgi:hypothetical protein
LQLASGLNVPVLFELKLTVPDGVSVPGALSVTVTKHEAWVLTVADEEHERVVVVDIKPMVTVALVVLELPP